MLNELRKIGSTSDENNSIISPTSSLLIELIKNNATDMYSPSDNCYSNECSECWKKYIDFLIESINNSDTSTKRFVPDVINKRFNELEALYLEPEEKKGGRD